VETCVPVFYQVLSNGMCIVTGFDGKENGQMMQVMMI